MQYSHSRVEQFEKCKFKFKLRYVDQLETLPNDDADNALILGTALHTGLEKNVEEAIKQYYMSYPVITDLHVNEAMKLEYLIPKAKEMIPPGEHEVKLENEDFIGFIDLLAPVEDDVFDLYDFKYSNNIDNYMQSRQLHEYKYFFELLNPGKKIRNMYFLFIPKISIRQKKTEDLNQFRNRLQEELNKSEVKLVPIEFDYTKVIDFTFGIKRVLEETDFEKNPSYLCRFCEYQNFCEKGEDFMILPKNERRNIEKIEKKVVWLYGSPFTGKTTFANKFPDPLMLNTDGNIKFVDAPYIAIKDNVEVQGRMTKKTFAWEIFKDVISELEKKENNFKSIVVDLLEDTYEYCRLYMYDKLGIDHESDDSFRAWDKVRTEFLSTLKRLMALDYENIILISHEDTTKDITKKGGDKLTSIKPNLADKVATKVAGMVDIVARVVADDKRILSFKTNEVIFGGGRLTTKTNEIPLDYDAFLEVYDEANKAAVASLKNETKQPVKEPEKTQEENNTTEEEKPIVDEPKTEEEQAEAIPSEEAPSEEAPKTRTRKRRTE